MTEKKSRRKQQETAVADALADSSGISALFVGSDYRVKWISPEARRVLGLKQEDTEEAFCQDLLSGKLCTEECKVSPSPTGQENDTPFTACCFTPHHPPFHVRTEVMKGTGKEPLGLLKSFRVVPPEETGNQPSSFVANGAWADELRALLPRIARSDLPILLIGETGTGKECLARMIHEESDRNAGPFVILDLSLVPETLIEDTLFGHTRGSFTGATHEQIGKLPLAEGGTLFLDEIQNIPPTLQMKLLRFLETGTFEQLGSRQTVRVDTRLIAATNEPPETLLQEKRIRPDLFYRLNGLSLEIPPLKERLEDIPVLIEHFRTEWEKRTGRISPRFSQELVHQLTTYPFPGNIRELKHMVDAALSLADPDKTMEFDHLPSAIKKQLRSSSSERVDPFKQDISRTLKERTVFEFERQRIEEALSLSGGRIIEASKRLGISRVTLWRKMKRLELPHDVS
ncbi:MAG: sigma 54-interacting transcriptional regulator [Leptospirales bacterium]